MEYLRRRKTKSIWTEEGTEKYHKKCKGSSSKEKTNGLWEEIKEIVKKSVTKKEIKLND